MDEFDRLTAIRRCAGPLADRIEFIPDAPSSLMDQMSCGIFFVMAFWSGPAVQAFQRLVDVVHRLDSTGRLRVVVADTDDIPHLHNSPPFIDILGGYGETLWIKDGQIIAHSGRGLNLECIEPNTVALLDVCKAP